MWNLLVSLTPITQALSTKKTGKIRLQKLGTTHRYTIRILSPLMSYKLECCITSYRQILPVVQDESYIACTMRQWTATEYINEFCKSLVNCAKVSDAESKFIFEMNLANWLHTFVLPYSYIDLHATMLCTKWISSIQDYCSAYKHQNNQNK